VCEKERSNGKIGSQRDLRARFTALKTIQFQEITGGL
jgi:hypothetical protein